MADKKITAGTNDWINDKGKLNPLPSFNFALEVEAMFFMPLKSVRVFNKENEFEYYQEGGINDYVHMLRKPISKPFTFQVERYVGTSASTDFSTSFLDPIALGTELILPVILYVTRRQAANSGDNFSFKNTPRCYIFTGCVVTAKEYGELNAEKSGLYTESTTIAYKEMFVINGLSTAWESGEVWQFPKSAENKDNKPSANVKWSDKDKKKEKDQWEYDGTVKGKGNAHDFRDKARGNHGKKPDPSLWEYDGTVAGKGPSHDLYDKAKGNHGKKPDPSLWEYDGTVKGGGNPHDLNKKPGGTAPKGTPWDIDSAKSPYTPGNYVHWSEKDTKAKPVIWEYDGTVTGKGTRRALMANELAKEEKV